MQFSRRPHRFLSAPCFLFWGLLAGQSQAQTTADSGIATGSVGVPAQWQSCKAMDAEPTAQLACFKQWANDATVNGLAAAPLPQAQAQPAQAQADARPTGCRDRSYSELSRFWELQPGSDCGMFTLRSYRPTSLAIVTSNSVNARPSSSAPGYTAVTAPPYQRTENRFSISLRTKIAKGIFKDGAVAEDDQDSLWFGYTQQSYWQMYTSAVSGAFRTTDHEPELVYIYPHRTALPGGWTYRLSGLGLVHQSNGQAPPLHRDWDRAYLLGAAEKTLGPDSSLTLQGRLWQRVRPFGAVDANPGIENYVGRAELSGGWHVNKANSLSATVRHSLRSTANGSTRLEWMFAPNLAAYSSLRYHVQYFSGYGDSLLDFNRRRSVLSVGLSLVDW